MIVHIPCDKLLSYLIYIISYCRMAATLIKTMAIRKSIYRAPYPDDDINPKYKAFEDSFDFEPTVDQLTCFQAVKEDMVRLIAVIFEIIMIYLLRILYFLDSAINQGQWID